MQIAEASALYKELESRCRPPFEKRGIGGKLSWRISAIKYFFSGKLGLKDLIVFLFFPTRLRRSQINLVVSLALKEIDAFFAEKNVYSEGNVQVFGNTVVPSFNNVSGWFDVLILVDQIIVSDQYATKENLVSDAVVFDVGANIGMFAVTAANIAKDGKIFAFEPGETTRRALAQNVSPYPHVKVIPKALADKPGKMNLYTVGFMSGSASLDFDFVQTGTEDEEKKKNIKTETVEVTTIDEFVKEQNLTRVDFIKIDAEGSEKKILTGARETIAKFHPFIACSAYHRPEDKVELPKLVRGIWPGYRVTLMQRQEEDFLFSPH
jgi:FkbM family methyltransferase